MMTDEPIRVLVVDDEPLVNQLIQSQLTNLGHTPSQGRPSTGLKQSH